MIMNAVLLPPARIQYRNELTVEPGLRGDWNKPDLAKPYFLPEGITKEVRVAFVFIGKKCSV